MDPSNSNYSSLDYVFDSPGTLAPLTIEELAIIFNRVGYYVQGKLQYIGGRKLTKLDVNARSRAIAGLLPDQIVNERMLLLYEGSERDGLYLTNNAHWVYVRPEEFLEYPLVVAKDDMTGYREGPPKCLMVLIREAGFEPWTLRGILENLENAVQATFVCASRRLKTLEDLSSTISSLVDRSAELR